MSFHAISFVLLIIVTNSVAHNSHRKVFEGGRTVPVGKTDYSMQQTIAKEFAAKLTAQRMNELNMKRVFLSDSQNGAKSGSENPAAHHHDSQFAVSPFDVVSTSYDGNTNGQTTIYKGNGLNKQHKEKMPFKNHLMMKPIMNRKHLAKAG